MEIETSTTIRLNSAEEYQTSDGKGRPMLVTALFFSSWMSDVYGHGMLLRKDGTPSTRRGIVRLPADDVPLHLRGAVVDLGLLSAPVAGAEAAKQAALG